MSLAGLSTSQPAFARVVVIGIDGGSWNVIDPLLKAGALPALSSLAARGVHADLETVEPLTSPVVWTSIATGRVPDDHGVVDFYTTRLRIRTPTSYERLAASGLRVGLYDVLMTWPPTVFPKGFVIPGWLRRDGAVTPHDVWERIEASPFVVHYDDLRTNTDYFDLGVVEVREKASRWIELAESFDLDVGAVSFYAADMTSHRFWRAAFPEDFDEPGPASPPEQRTAIANSMRGIDRSIGEIADSMDQADTLIVVSDHGFQARPEGTRPVWVTRFEKALELADLDPNRDAFEVLSTFGAVILSIDRGPVEERDPLIDRLVTLVESCTDANGDPLFRTNLLDVLERPPGAERPLLERLRQWVVGLVVEYWFGVEPDDTANAIVFGLPRESTLESLWPGGKVRVADKLVPIDTLMSRQEFSGAHHPVGIMLAAGGPIAHLPKREHTSVLEVAPLLFYLAGRGIPDDLPGRLRDDWIRPAHLAENPPSRVAAETVPTLHSNSSEPPEPDPSGPENERALTEKLRALGYVE